MEFGSDKVYIVVGPPGCGKSTWTAKQSKRAVEKYGAEKVYILSLTRAAARVIGSRDSGALEDHVGTMHSFCFRVLGTPKLVSRKDVEEGWNALHPYWSISPSVVGTSSARIEAGEDIYSDAFLRLDRKRHKYLSGISGAELEPDEKTFFDAWTAWKLERGVVDFTQLIEDTIRFRRTLEPQPAVIFVDEAQDFSTLEVQALRLWADDAEHLVLVGDLAQSIYDFHGATREAMGGAESILLDQSYRLPRQVWLRAREMMGRMTETPVSELKPREEEGEVTTGPSFKMTDWYLQEILSRPDDTFMLVAPCGYMIDGLVAKLRENFIPYWNPYAPRETRWNPLARKVEIGKVQTVQRFIDYMSGQKTGMWSTAQIKSWVPLFAHIWRRGHLKSITEHMTDDDSPRVATNILLSFVLDEFRNDLLDFYPKWIIDHAAMKYLRMLEFYTGVVSRWGVDSLTQEPRVIVGTIHSVKGGEADHVVVFPDLSPRWHDMLQRPGWENADSVFRLFYVGMTRAKRRLILADAATRFAIGW